METATDIPALDWPQSAQSLLAQAKAQSASRGELVKLIMAGIRRLDSWLIENRVLPALQARRVRTLEFDFTGSDHRMRSAFLMPLPDGSAFACSVGDRWSALERYEAKAAIQYIGFRYAPSTRWTSGFQAFVHTPGEVPAPVGPGEVAQIWREITGQTPQGFTAGVLDQIEAFGLGLMNKTFNTQGRLGL